ncbi:MAG: 50S ribosomal protein L10 [Candidatus Pacearchaeota archaeon]
MKTKTSRVSEEKIKMVSELSNLINNKSTILLVSIKDISASQYQEIVKKLRGKAVVKVPKKNIIFKAIDLSKNELVKKIKDYINKDYAILFSDIDPFELALELVNKKSFVKARAGQFAPTDIVIPAGPTDLMSGPIISEFGALGIKILIEKGKITIKEPKTILKKGEKISNSAVDIMNKLDIKPFSVGFVPLVAYNKKENKIYTNIEIDQEKTIKELKEAFYKSLSFAVSISYFCSDTIRFLIQKAVIHKKILEKFINKNEEDLKN